MDPQIKAKYLNALTRTERLAAAPRVLGRVLQLLRNTDSALHAIAELINLDSALAVDVLRCANSAYYRRGAPVGAIDEAIHVIGFHETIRIVSLVVIRQSAHRNLGSYGIAADDNWAESLYNGLFFENLAKRTPGVDPALAYTAGLLRFIGRLAIDQTIEQLGGGLFWDGHIPLPEWEQAHVGITQSAAGALLLGKWEFPPAVITAIGTQDLPAASWSELHEPLSRAMNATALLLPAGLGLAAIEAATTPLGDLPPHHPFTAAGLTPDDLAAIRFESLEAFRQIRHGLYPDAS